MCIHILGGRGEGGGGPVVGKFKCGRPAVDISIHMVGKK